MMATEKLARILRSKSAMSEAEIGALTDAEGWDWIYRNTAKPKPRSQQICFTGFNAPDAEELRTMAQGCGWLKVATTVTTTLTYLCTGDNPGPAKLEKARQVGSVLLSREQFIRLLADGELPLEG
jgi:BRCT domain type II-containing protein